MVAENNQVIIRTENLGKAYPLPGNDWLRVFEGIDFELRAGELVAVMGVSGVGKTTFLNIIGGLDRPTEGRVFFQGQNLWEKTPTEIAMLRNRYIGFVFQFYHLLPEFSALENVAIPLLIGGRSREEALEQAARALEEVGMGARSDARPAQLSGGEQQRVAVARALVTSPGLLLADEPTGNLDWKTGEKILELITDLHRKKGLSSIIVTHNERIARFCHKAYLLEAGRMKLLEGLAG
ncbi:MAG: Lipoprotein releasing system ATP-binding protein LolD [Candidatus Saccharicenans subterraneus]|uniref:Lipoprotein releasing system ATP-binding protein LolD n=1 Tax=Candidatus Saccharicenans subterraneus TaxID=2508984 RepID=A0A3E2BK48_9BACT|nr:MAG: Lipoprotein releasing system ATP-binding protein LolD [Candidatus Saccharicenans subterraneum]